jgi:hypothetical protein
MNIDIIQDIFEHINRKYYKKVKRWNKTLFETIRGKSLRIQLSMKYYHLKLCRDTLYNRDLVGTIYAIENGHDTIDCFGHAIAGGSLECVKYIHDKFTPNNEARYCNIASTRGHLECLKFLIEHGYHYNQWTLMYSTSQGRNTKCLEYLHELCCNDKTQFILYDSILAYARKERNFECFEYVLTHERVHIRDYPKYLIMYQQWKSHR